MERFCGHLKHGGAASKRFPYRSLDHYVFNWTILWHIGFVYDLRGMLKLRKTRKNSDDDRKLEVPGREFDKSHGGFIHLRDDPDNGYVLTTQQPLALSSTSDIFLLVLQGIMRHLPGLDRLATWRVHNALTTATFSEWTRFTKNNSQDTFHSASQSSRKAGARNAQYARVSKLPPARNQAITHCN